MLENAGLQRDDPRLEAFVSRTQHYLRHVHRHRQTDDTDRQRGMLVGSVAATGVDDDVMLDRDEFNDCIQHRCTSLHRSQHSNYMCRNNFVFIVNTARRLVVAVKIKKLI